MYNVLWLYLVDARSGEGRQGKSHTASGASICPRGQGRLVRGHPWRSEAAATLRLPTHDVGMEDVKRDECEKDFYLAELALLNGDTATATILFRQSVDTNITEFVEYKAAGIELDRLKH